MLLSKIFCNRYLNLKNFSFSFLNEADGVSLKEGMTTLPGTVSFAVFCAWLLYKYFPKTRQTVTLFVNFWRSQRTGQSERQGQGNRPSFKRNNAKSETGEGASGGIELETFKTNDSAGASGHKTDSAVNGDNAGTSGESVEKFSKEKQDSGAGTSSMSDDTYVKPVQTSKEGPTSILKKKKYPKEVRKVVNEVAVELERSNPEYEQLLSPAKTLRERRANMTRNKNFREKVFGSDTTIDIEERSRENFQTLVNSWKLEDGKAVGGAKSKVAGRKLTFGTITSTPYKSLPSENEESFFSVDADPELGTSPLDTSHVLRNRNFPLNESFASRSKSDDDLCHSKLSGEEEFHGDMIKLIGEGLEFKSPHKRQEKDLLGNTITVHDATFIVPDRGHLINISAEDESQVIDTNTVDFSSSMESAQTGDNVQTIQVEIHVPQVLDEESEGDEGAQVSTRDSESHSLESGEKESNEDIEGDAEDEQNEENTNTEQAEAGKPVEAQSEKPESESKETAQKEEEAKPKKERKPRKKKEYQLDEDRKSRVGNRNKSRDRNN